jgi:hypothetical protein
MRLFQTLILVAATAAIAFAVDPPVVTEGKAPEGPKAITFKAKVGVPLRLTAEKASEWLLDDADGVLVADADGKGAVFVSFRPKVFKLYAYTAAGDVASKATPIVVTAEGAAPVVPPTPIPPPPSPQDPLVLKLAAAYKTPDPAALKDLIVFYGEAQKLCLSKEVTTLMELIGRIQAAGKLMVGDRLIPVRQAVAEHLAGQFGDDGPLTDAVRARVAGEYAKIAAALSQLGA